MAPWIASPRFDLTFFFGASALGLVLGLLAVRWPVLAAPLWWGWVLFAEGPHLLATFARTYFNPRERERRRRLLNASWLLFLPAPFVLGVGWLIGSRAPFDLVLLFASLWALHHGIRQSWGILALYERRAGTPAPLRRFDWFYLHVGFWLLFGVFALLHPEYRRYALVGETGLRWLFWLGVAALATLQAAMLGSLVVRWRRGVSMLPALFALGPVAGFNLLTYLFVGRLEPIFGPVRHPEQLFVVITAIVGIMHGVQYLGIVTVANRVRHATDERSPLLGRLGRAPLLGYAIFVAISLAYVALNAARGASPGYAIFAPDGQLSRFILALYWGLFFHHYYLDQRIWRPHEDPELRRELGLT